MVSDGYRQGYVSFAHILLYLKFLILILQIHYNIFVEKYVLTFFQQKLIGFLV